MDLFSFGSSKRNISGYGAFGSDSNGQNFGGQFDLFGTGPTPLERMLQESWSPRTRELLDMRLEPSQTSSFQTSSPWKQEIGTSLIPGPSFSSSSRFMDVESDQGLSQYPLPLQSALLKPKLSLSPSSPLSGKSPTPSAIADHLHFPTHPPNLIQPKTETMFLGGPSLDDITIPNSFNLARNVTLDNIFLVERISGDLIYRFEKKPDCPRHAVSKPTISLTIKNANFQITEDTLTSHIPLYTFAEYSANGQLNRVCRTSLNTGSRFDNNIPLEHNHTDAVICQKGDCPVANSWYNLSYLTLESKVTHGSGLTSANATYHCRPHPKDSPSFSVGVKHQFQGLGGTHEAGVSYNSGAIHHSRSHYKKDPSISVGVKHQFQGLGGTHEVGVNYKQPLSTQPREQGIFEVAFKSLFNLLDPNKRL
ncbi:hypothetical protein BJX66DRAFT_320848 [Aspergillus keveii]|uniref:Uncharacterized protein n=1 Tax=Aspergillus keveii TaxID=714993 RepID=A0ABR4FGM1_9EURO